MSTDIHKIFLATREAMVDDYLNLEFRDEQKKTLARLAASIEGLDDEALHAVFVSRAVKKSIWDENDLLDSLEANMGWKREDKERDEEDRDFDELFEEIIVNTDN